MTEILPQVVIDSMKRDRLELEMAEYKLRQQASKFVRDSIVREFGPKPAEGEDEVDGEALAAVERVADWIARTAMHDVDEAIKLARTKAEVNVILTQQAQLVEG